MLNSNIVITNKEKLEQAKRNIIQAGSGRLQVLSDFDKTLTRCFVDGKKIASLISVLRDEHYLTPDYAGKAQALFEKYHPVEIDPTIPLSEKQRLMREWWSTHYQLLIESGLKKSDIKKVAESKKVELRSGATEFFGILHEKNIPLVILSASGLGVDAISMYLDRADDLYSNVHIASNVLLWDEAGRFIGAREPIVHSFNKNYETVRSFPFFEKIKERRNILFLGDGVDDVQMLKGFEYDNIIKIGFLNEKIEEKLPEFREAYDVIILNDGSLDYLNKLVPAFNDFKETFDVVILNDGPLDYVNALLNELVAVKR